jgi:hypothetical protein
MGACVAGETGGETIGGDGDSVDASSGDGDGTSGDGDGTSGDGDGTSGDGDGTSGDGDGTSGDGDGDAYPCNVYVDPDPGISVRDGTSWATAFDDVADSYATAIGNAADDRCAVWIAAGTYHAYASGIADSFRFRPFVDVYGGFAGGATALSQRDRLANPVVLDGRQTDSAGSPQVRHVVTAEGDNQLDSLDIRWGRAALFSSCSGATCDPGRGAGVLATAGDLEIRGSAFTQNSAWSGAAVYHAGGDLTVEDCVFDGNVMDTSLGSLTNGEEVNGAVVETHGEAFAFRRSVIASTLATNPDSDASLALFSSAVTTTIEDSVFTNNRGAFGTVWVRTDDPFGSATIRRSSFVGSDPVAYSASQGLALTYESALFVPLTLSDSAFVRNGVNQGSSYSTVRIRSSTARFLNTTMIDNGPPIANSSGPVTFVNSIVRTNQSNLLSDPQVTASYCLGDGLSGGTNLDVDPMFVSNWLWIANIAQVTYDPTTHQTRIDASGGNWPPGLLAGRYVRFGSDVNVAHHVVSDNGNSLQLWGDVTANGGDTISYSDPSLLTGSMAIDSGDDGNATTTDIDGNPRVGVVDRGAFEFQP